MPVRKEMVENKEQKGVGVTRGDNTRSNTDARKGFDELRKHKRFQVPGGVFVGFGPRANKVGQIVDVSMGGLGYRYVGSEDSSDGSHLDIFVTDDDFYMGAVPFKTVCDFQVVDRVPASPMTMRRCGVQFGKLSRKQNAQLEYFIQQHTLGEA
jgi:hypothetical protein